MPIMIRARAMPMVRTISPMRCFWPAKTCSTAERTAERFALARALGHGPAVRLSLVDIAGEHTFGQERLVLLGAVGCVGPYARGRVVRADEDRQPCAIGGAGTQVRIRPCVRSMLMWFL